MSTATVQNTYFFPDACGFKGEGTEDGIERLLGAKQ